MYSYLTFFIYRKNGEKTNPIPMESEINKNPVVKNCMIIGANRECTAALIELAMDEAIKYSPMEIISEGNDFYYYYYHLPIRFFFYKGILIPIELFIFFCIL